MNYLRRLMASGPMTVCMPGQGVMTAAVLPNDWIQAARGKDYIFVNRTADKPNTGRQLFTLPAARYGRYWLPVIDDASKNYAKPTAIEP